MKRETITTEGKRISFDVDKDYFVVGADKKKVFDGSFKRSKYAVAYTEVKSDVGTRFENRFGCPASVYYDNGIVGYQNFTYFNDKTEAIKDFEGRQKLTPKIGTIAYADVFLIENN